MMIPVILSGGVGTRLWPVSQINNPKPFIKLPDGETLLQKTYARVIKLNNIREIYTVTNKEYHNKCIVEFNKINNEYIKPLFNCILEPFSRNTAPAITLAALTIADKCGDESIMLVLPSDHIIDDLNSFLIDISKAHLIAQLGKIVTFGFTPTRPETGYGYIEMGDLCALNDFKFYKTNKFIEKPNVHLAEMYIKTKRFLWNGGMLCFQIKTFLQEMEKYDNELLIETKNCWLESKEESVNQRTLNINKALFHKINNISIDYALLEKSQNIVVLPCEFNREDIGSWDSFKLLLKSDKNHNNILGEAITIDSFNNLIYGKEKIIACIGVNDLLIIDTPHALLIVDRHRSQEVKDITEKINKSKQY